jgi:hypothetical protein
MKLIFIFTALTGLPTILLDLDGVDLLVFLQEKRKLITSRAARPPLGTDLVVATHFFIVLLADARDSMM